MSKQYTAILLCSLIVLCLVPGVASAQLNRGDDRVCVYRDNNFNGREQCYSPGQDVSDLRGAEVSSIRVFGRARAVIYEDRDFRGNTSEFVRDVSDLARVPMPGSGRAWNDRVGSLRVIGDNGRYGSDRDRDRDRDRRSGDYGYPDYPNSPSYPSGRQNMQQGVCVYDRPNYNGRSQCWSSTTEMANLGGWNDKIQSIRVFGNARVMAFRDSGFRGERVVIDRDVPNFNRVGMRNWDRQISSLEIQGDNGRRRGTYGRY